MQLFAMRKMSPALLGAALWGLSLLLFPPAALAAGVGPSPYLSFADSPFTQVFTYFHLENFEDGVLNTPGVTAAGSSLSVIGPGGNTDSVDADDGTIDGSGTLGRSLFANPGSTGITFTFSAAVLGFLPTHVGIVWTDGAGTTSFQAFGPGGLLGSLGPVAIADGSFLGTTAEDRFFGWVDLGGISSILITNTSGGIEVDHLQYGFLPIPLPAGVWLLGSGLAALAAWRRRVRH